MQNFELMYARSILTQGMMYAPLADARMSYVDARDIGAVAAHLLGEEKYQYKEYDVTGPEAITCTQLAEIFSSFLHTPVHYATISDEETEKALLGRYSPWRAHAVVTLLQFYRQGGGNLVTPVVDEVNGTTQQWRAASLALEVVWRETASYVTRALFTHIGTRTWRPTPLVKTSWVVYNRVSKPSCEVCSMPRNKRPQRERTHDWQKSDNTRFGQYEALRPVVLFNESAAEQAKETGMVLSTWCRS
jgi:hypothetical protein